MAIICIDIVSHMWLGFPVHEAMAIHRKAEIISKLRTNEEVAKIGTPQERCSTSASFGEFFPEYLKCNIRAND
jgi:hypothetical protein